MKLIISRCLLGVPCRYDGCVKTDLRPALHSIGFRADDLIAVCPETDGGLPTPRAPSEIIGGSATDVLAGHARVMTASGADNTAAFLNGAEIALDKAMHCGARIALLKSRSPSCGSTSHYDGTFSGTLVPGPGVTTALFEQNGIHVCSEDDLPELARLCATQGKFALVK